MSDINVTTSTIEASTNTTEVTGKSDNVVVVDNEVPDTSISFSKNDYSIVGDTLYASVSGTAPPWLSSVIDAAVGTSLAASLSDLSMANSNLITALSEIEIAENQYQQLINIQATVDASVISSLTSINTTIDQNRSDIVSLDISKTTAAQALAISADRIAVEMGPTGSIGAEVNRIDSAIANLDLAYSSSIVTLTAAYDSNSASISTLETAVANIDSIDVNRVTLLEAQMANNSISGLSSVINSIQVDLDNVTTNWQYDSVININGDYYRSGFGLSSTATAGTGTEVDPFISEFWINAKAFVVKDGTTEYIRWDGASLNIEGNVATGSAGERVELNDLENNLVVYSLDGSRIIQAGNGANLYTDFTESFKATVLITPKPGEDIGLSVIGDLDYSIYTKGYGIDGVNSIRAQSTSNGTTSGTADTTAGMFAAITSGTAIFQPNGGAGGNNIIGVVGSSIAKDNLQSNGRCIGVNGRAFTYSNNGSGANTLKLYGGFFDSTYDFSGTAQYTIGVYARSYNIGVQGSGFTYDFYASGSGANYGPFTGSHDALVVESTVLTVGDILCDDVVVASKNVSNTIFTAVLASNVGEIPIGIMTTYGDDVVPSALSELEVGYDAEGNSTENEVGSIPTGYRTIVINSLGEGQLNVCGEGGDMLNGDLIVTSSMPGKGMKQADNIVRSITVAKARGDHSFSSTTEVKMIPCIYLCG